MSDIELARKELTGDRTLVLRRGEDAVYSVEKGVNPMLRLIGEGRDVAGFSAADRIVGKAAALLFVLAGVKEVYGEVMSVGATEVLKAHNIPFGYGVLSEKIINRMGTDICPMEKTVADIEDPAAAYAAIRETAEKLRKKSMKAKVYFSRELTPEKVSELYDALGVNLPGNVAVKLHSGEEGNQNYLTPEFWRPVIERVGGTVVECNTAYEGERNTTEKHLKTIEKHGWNRYFTVDLMDAEGPDVVLDIPDGKRIKKNYVGKNLLNYDSMLVLSHFKGHPMGGYGGALKQLSIGVASSYGKAYIHGVGNTDEIWTADHDGFLESMADAACSVVRHFGGNAAYLNVMKNMSVDCDCCAVAEDPCMKDIGVLASLDPVAIDRACLDLVYASDDPGRDHLLERIESRNGAHTIEAAEALGVGSTEYELIEL